MPIETEFCILIWHKLIHHNFFENFLLYYWLIDIELFVIIIGLIFLNIFQWNYDELDNIYYLKFNYSFGWCSKNKIKTCLFLFYLNFNAFLTRLKCDTALVEVYIYIYVIIIRFNYLYYLTLSFCVKRNISMKIYAII